MVDAREQTLYYLKKKTKKKNKTYKTCSTLRKETLIKGKVCTQTFEELHLGFVGSSAHGLDANQTNPNTQTCVLTGSFMTQTNEVLLSVKKLGQKKKKKPPSELPYELRKKRGRGKKSKRRQKH